MHKILMITGLLIHLILQPTQASTPADILDETIREKPHIILHMEAPVLTSPLGDNLQPSEEDYTSIVGLVQYIQKSHFPLTVALHYGKEKPTLLKQTLEKFCGITPQHHGILSLPFTLATERQTITGVGNILSFLTPSNHGVWQEDQSHAAGESYFPIPAEGNILPFYLANPESTIQVISPLENLDPMGSYFFEKVGQIIRFNPHKLRTPSHLCNFFQHYMKINGYDFIPENKEERGAHDRTLDIDAGVDYSAHGAAEENRTLDPTLTKGVLYH